MATSRAEELRVFVFAPFGRDAELICESLRAAGIDCEVVAREAPLVPDLSNGTGALIVAEEAFTTKSIQEFAVALRNQPEWSDSPLIVLSRPRTDRGQVSRFIAALREHLGHTTVLERPLRPETLVSTVETALRARERQYQVRDMLAQLRRSEGRYRSLAIATSSIVWAADREGHFIEPLSSWERYTGQSFEQYRGLGWLGAIHPDDRNNIEPVFFGAVQRDQPFQLEYRLNRHDHQYRWVIAHAVPVLGGGGSPKEWVGTCIDVQDRKDSEAALRKSERLALAGQFAATIAHEINNPLEAVTNLIYLIRTRSNDEDIRKYATLAESELGRVAELSGQTLRFYKRSTEAVPTSVPEVLETLLGLFSSKLGRMGIKVEKRINQTERVLAFGNELRQLFANLISNAIDASPRGRLIVCCRNSRDWRDPSRRGVRITVADTGSGIPAKLRRSIFEPFFTTKGEAGTGLGLWVSADVVERHGGQLSVRSKTSMPSGTVFSVFLPYDHTPEPQPPDAAPPLR
jgi:PAS domain S-box-containing protein